MAKTNESGLTTFMHAGLSLLSEASNSKRERLVRRLAKNPKVRNPEALATWLQRRKGGLKAGEHKAMEKTADQLQRGGDLSSIPKHQRRKVADLLRNTVARRRKT